MFCILFHKNIWFIDYTFTKKWHFQFDFGRGKNRSFVHQPEIRIGHSLQQHTLSEIEVATRMHTRMHLIYLIHLIMTSKCWCKNDYLTARSPIENASRSRAEWIDVHITCERALKRNELNINSYDIERLVMLFVNVNQTQKIIWPIYVA